MTSQHLPYVYLIVVFFAGWLPFNVTWAQGPSCAGVFSQVQVRQLESEEISEDAVQTMIHEFAKIAPGSSEKAIENHFMETSPLYEKLRKFLNPDFGPRARVITFLKDFFLSFLKPHRLIQLRESSLAKQLHAWGGSDSSGYPQLETLSAQNMQRVLRNFQLTSVKNLPREIRDVVENIDFEYRHNTNMAGTAGPIMLSSARLRQAGLPNTAQSTYSFNRDIVKSDDQLYFYVQPIIRRSGYTRQNIHSRYGNKSIYLNEQFAQKKGWISAFIMTESDLISYHDSLKTAGFGIQKFETQGVGMLSLNVYTVGDFTTLYRSIVGNYLAKNSTAQGFLPSPDRLMAQLKGTRSYSSSDAITDLREFMQVFGISGGLMELKVPVAIETKYLRNSDEK